MVDDRDSRSDAQIRIGTILRGKYRIDGVIGVGGMATVYAATHRNRAELAIKILHSDLASEPGVRKRFLLEACSANSVKHPGVVKVVDDDVAEDGSAFLVMDRLKGSTTEELRARRGGKLGLHAAVAVADQLLEVLTAAHAEGIVHRDVKPANLFITGDGDVKVLDFGIARSREALPNDLCLTGAATIMGTPTYMAPEQALPGMTEIDERTDLWAAGATLFTLISGHTVHEGETTGEIVFKAATEPGRSLASVAPATPRAIAEVVDCALAFEKSARWASAHEMRSALRAAYRLHFGRAPSRTSLEALRDPPASGVDSEDTLFAPSLPGRIRCVGRVRGVSIGPAPSHGDMRPSRTSIPVAADVRPTLLTRRLRARPAWVLGTVTALGVIVCAARWWAGFSGAPDSPVVAPASAPSPPDPVADSRLPTADATPPLPAP
jgi:serine/threonine protein kinase